MSYIGEQPRFSDYPSQLISPNGTDTSFTLTNSVGTPASIIVCISGVKQSVNAYAVTGTTLDFGAGNPPPAGTNTLGSCLSWAESRPITNTRPDIRIKCYNENQCTNY